MLGAARDGLDVSRGNRQAKQLADELAQGLVGWTVPRVINVMLQVVEQLTAALIPLAQFARQRAVQNLIQPVVHARIQRPEIRDGQGHHVLPGFLRRGALEDILSKQQVGQHHAGGKEV